MYLQRCFAFLLHEDRQQAEHKPKSKQAPGQHAGTRASMMHIVHVVPVPGFPNTLAKATISSPWNKQPESTMY